MRKILLTVLLLIMALSAVGLAVACNDKNPNSGNNPPAPEQETKKLAFDKYTHEMDLFDQTFTLTLQNTDVPETAVWNSSNATVATVDKGLVMAQGVGQTEITAKIGEQTAVCYLTVSYSGTVPLVQVGAKEIRLAKGDEYPLDPKIVYNSAECEGASFEFSSTDSNVITVDASGKITAVALGEAQIKVVASWRNIESEYLTEHITVKVVREIQFEFSKPKVEIYTIQSFDGKQYDTTSELTCNVTVDGEAYDQVEYIVEDTAICEYSGSTVSQKAKAGKTLITAKINYEGVEYSDSVEVNIIRPVKEIEDRFYFSRALKDVSFLLDDPTYSQYSAQEICEIIVEKGDNDLVIEVEGNQANDIGSLEYGKAIIAVNTEKFGYIYNNAQVVDLYLTAPQHVDVMRANAGDLKEVILGKDINMAGYPCTENYDNKTFSGTFDGNGYTISNLEYKTGVGVSLFQRLTGTVKNLILKDVLINGLQSGGLCMELKGGKIENVYISISLMSCNTSGGFAKQLVAGDSVIKDSVVYVTSSRICSFNGGLLISYINSATWNLSVENSYAVTAVKGAVLAGRADKEPYITTGKTINDMHTAENPIIYDSVESFRIAVASGKAKADVATCEKIGIKDDVVRVSTVEDLQAMRTTYKQNKLFVLTNDIILEGEDAVFGPTENTKFYGTFDGGGHEIRGMVLSGQINGYGMGFFGQIESATIRNVAFTNVTFATQYANQGVIAAAILEGVSPSVIENVFVSVDLANSQGKSGGFAGWAKGNCKIINSIIMMNGKLAQTTDGLFVGVLNSDTTTLDLSGSYAIYADGETNVNLVGDSSKNTTAMAELNALTGKSYTLTEFNNANIDFSSYDDAVKNAVNALKK